MDLEGDDLNGEAFEGDEVCDAAALVDVLADTLAASKKGEALRRRAPRTGCTRSLEGLSSSLLGELCRPVLVVGMVASFLVEWKPVSEGFVWTMMRGVCLYERKNSQQKEVRKEGRAS